MIGKKVPSLLDLCVNKAIDNVKYLGDVGETDSYLLDRILSHCTVDQLRHVENCTKVKIKKKAKLFGCAFLFYYYIYLFWDKSCRREIWVRWLISCGRDSTRGNSALQTLRWWSREWRREKWHLHGWNYTRLGFVIFLILFISECSFLVLLCFFSMLLNPPRPKWANYDILLQFVHCRQRRWK